MDKLTQKARNAITLIFSGVLFSITLAHTSTFASKPSSNNTQKNIQKNIQQLDSDFQELHNEYLIQFAKYKPAKQYLSSKALYNAVTAESDSTISSNIIRANKDLLIETSSATEFSSLLEHLYTNNDTATIRDVTSAIKNMRDNKKSSRNYFLLAKYYFERSHWQGLQAALSNVDPKTLSLGDEQYYLLLMGYSLQESKKHRESVTYYKKIPRSSPYFAHAKLNEGIAYLRQGWWSEAHMEFNDAIASIKESNKNQKTDNDFANRILVVLGFSQIDNEFYRDARRTLRNVALDSEYTNKAMMGLGIAAAHQKDFPGALNIFERLTQKKLHDKNVDEAYLLVPYGYEELGDFVNASTKYQAAIQYYQSRLIELNQASQKLTNATDTQLVSIVDQLNQSGKELYDILDATPKYFITNYYNIVKMQNTQLSKKMAFSVNDLHSKYKQQLRILTAENIQARTTTINSYLSQAQFGVAKLYDKE